MRKTFPWLLELLTRFLASWIAGAKSHENPNGGRTGRSALRTLCIINIYHSKYRVKSGFAGCPIV
jgi:hypothetical protein